jgi:RNA polymerase sigma factor (TIGR02999 family)
MLAVAISNRDALMCADQTQITSLLCAVGNGDAGAAEQLWRVVYDELHRVAKARMAHERRGDVQTTILVQEAYLRLVGTDGDGANIPANRRHFFAAAANAMRCFLVDDARRKGRQKRGGGRASVELWEAAAALESDPAEVLALDEALAKLREYDPRKAEIVQLRYFAGLSTDETAEVLGLSPRQVDKEWRFAKAWLHRLLR